MAYTRLHPAHNNPPLRAGRWHANDKHASVLIPLGTTVTNFSSVRDGQLVCAKFGLEAEEGLKSDFAGFAVMVPDPTLAPRIVIYGKVDESTRGHGATVLARLHSLQPRDSFAWCGEYGLTLKGGRGDGRSKPHLVRPAPPYMCTGSDKLVELCEIWCDADAMHMNCAAWRCASEAGRGAIRLHHDEGWRHRTDGYLGIYFKGCKDLQIELSGSIPNKLTRRLRFSSIKDWSTVVHPASDVWLRSCQTGQCSWHTRALRSRLEAMFNTLQGTASERQLITASCRRSFWCTCGSQSESGQPPTAMAVFGSAAGVEDSTCSVAEKWIQAVTVSPESTESNDPTPELNKLKLLESRRIRRGGGRAKRYDHRHFISR
jgi:hypothetical protein